MMSYSHTSACRASQRCCSSATRCSRSPRAASAAPSPLQSSARQCEWLASWQQRSSLLQQSTVFCQLTYRALRPLLVHCVHCNRAHLGCASDGSAQCAVRARLAPSTGLAARVPALRPGASSLAAFPIWVAIAAYYKSKATQVPLDVQGVR